ncbi:hypothetical protein ESA94_15375 [Lacibacter luteus]|uniref:Lipoprotein n=1 Tax=Lacibacter luteus TaxID=2508719 RepID=A0A4Q1CFN1_9BACT|nr:hypothetical protein [Lacibacter luteus]RXK58769.1 hypothetical protein ESA94_15375 [Lacibacter luteus]
MKKVIVLLAVIVAAASCKKEKQPAPESPNAMVKGYWIGKLGTDASNYINDFSILFKEDGTLRIYGLVLGTDTTNVDKFDGTYALTPDKKGLDLSYNHKGQYTATLSGGFLNENKQIKGVWVVNGTANQGAFYLNKQ